MKILLTGANGYIGQRLLPALLQDGHEVICMVRDPRRFKVPETYANKEYFPGSLKVLKCDLLDIVNCDEFPKDIDVAYYLVHSMAASSKKDFQEAEENSARNFVAAMEKTEVKQVVYLTGIVNDKKLSRHLSSRLNVENILREGKYHLTALRAAIIIGSGSASFEIIRDLVEKLPVMVAPKWLNVRCQAIAIRDVIQYLKGVLLQEKAYDRIFDIGGPDVLNYKDMLLKFAKVRNLNRSILIVPVLTPRISSYWLYFITSTTYQLARSLVDSLCNEVVCRHKGIEEIVPIKCLSYEDAIDKAFQKIEQNQVVSSWTDSLVRGTLNHDFLDSIKAPEYGCLTDEQHAEISRDPEEVRKNIWAIGGTNGWYHMDWAWAFRGFLDKLVGGVGLRKYRRDPHELQDGDALDFWRVLIADKEQCRLLLYAEMKLPGEAWLDFSIIEKGGKKFLKQKATFRPHGVFGRLYWHVLEPMHFFVFRGMVKAIANS